MRAGAWLGVVAGIAIAVAAVFGFAAWRWDDATTRAVARLDATLRQAGPASFADSMVADLPAPVARYFRSVLRDGEPIATRWHVTQRGTFRTGEGEDSWRPFEAAEFFRAMPPGFVWTADIHMAPGMVVSVRDGYVEGRGAMRGDLWRLFPMVSPRTGPELDQGALLRYLAEAPWCPTALLPANGVRWTAIDDSTARAALTDGATTVSAVFRFAADSTIAGVRAAARYRAVRNGYEARPWDGTMTVYEDWQGMRVPIEAEVAWEMPGGRQPYWRGRVMPRWRTAGAPAASRATPRSAGN